MTEVARRLDATTRTVSNYETQGAPDRTAAAIALATGCTTAFLRMPATHPLEEERVFFRARRRSTAAQKHAAAADATANVDAFSLWEDNNPYVFLSTMKTAERSRFDLAHEIGHLIMHGGLDGSPGSEQNAEKEADQFASSLLMPKIALRSALRREPSIHTIVEAKSRFGVSAMAMAYAAHKAGLLTDWSYRQACVELTRRGYRTAEPEGMPREMSRVFGVVLPALHKSKGWHTDEIARKLGVVAAEVHGLTFGQAIAMIDSGQGTELRGRPSRGHLSVVG